MSKLKNHSDVLVIRADADSKIGIGHFIRCSALAQYWLRQGGRVYFLTANTRVLANQASGINFIKVVGNLANPLQLLDLIKDKKAVWVVIDGYHFGIEFLKKIRYSNARILLIDDTAELKKFPADILLNQNNYSSPSMYEGKTSAKLLLGEKYVLLRSILLSEKKWERPFTSTANRMLVTFGGADTSNLGVEFMRGYSQLSIKNPLRTLSIRMVLGPMSNNIKLIKKMALQAENCQILTGVSDMGEHIRWCDYAVSSAGSTVWELSLYQTPMVLVPVSPSEHRIAQNMKAALAALTLNNEGKIDFSNIFSTIEIIRKDRKLRTAMGKKAGKIIDGDGVVRVVRAMKGFDN